MKVTDVDLSMNGTSIACGIEYYDVNNGIIAECYSSTGILYVKAKLDAPVSLEDVPVGNAANMVTSTVWIALLLAVIVTTKNSFLK